jgi:pimeloyl-ACP methyl ester carboxylesterase
MSRYVLIGCAVFAILVVGVLIWAWSPDKTRANLESKYLAQSSDYVSVLGLNVHVRDSGPRGAPVLILLHGFGSSLHTWEPWAARLAQTYRVIRYDQPGAGLTGTDPTGDYSDTRGLAVLTALLNHFDVQQATLIGNSMGGKLAWKFAAKFAATEPDRVTKLVLISPDGYASPGFDYDKSPVVPWVVSAMRYALPKSMLRSSLTAAYGDPARLTDATLTRYHDLMLAPGVRDGMIARMKQMRLVRPEPLLRQIKVPVLLMWGEKDGMIPFANAQDYGRVLPNSRLVSFPDLGHVPHEEAPDQSVRALEAFLAQ